MQYNIWEIKTECILLLYLLTYLLTYSLAALPSEGVGLSLNYNVNKSKPFLLYKNENEFLNHQLGRHGA